MASPIFQQGQKLYYQTPTGFQYIENPEKLQSLAAAGTVQSGQAYQPLPMGANIVGTPSASTASPLQPLPQQPGEREALINKYVAAGYGADAAAKLVDDLFAGRPKVQGTAPPSLTFAPTGETLPTTAPAVPTGTSASAAGTAGTAPVQGTMMGFTGAMQQLLSHYQNVGALQDQRNKLLQQLYDRPLTPEEMRTLSPDQQAAIRNADKGALEYQVMSLNDVIKGRADDFSKSLDYMIQGYKSDQEALQKKQQTAYDNFTKMIDKYPDIASAMSPEGFAALQRGEMPGPTDLQKAYTAYKSSVAAEKAGGILTIDKALSLAAASVDPATTMRVLTPYIGKTSADAAAALQSSDTSMLFSAIAKAKTGAALDNTDVSSIAQAIESGSLPPDMSGFGMGGAGKIKAALAKDGYNLTNATLDWKATQKYVQTLNGPQYTRLRDATNFAYESLDVMQQLNDEWKRGGFGPFNKARLELAKSGSLGQSAQSIATRFENQMVDMQAELAVVYRGGNAPTNEAMQNAEKQLSGEWSEQTFLDNINLLRTNLGIRKNSIGAGGPLTVSGGSTSSAGNVGPGGPDDPLNLGFNSVGGDTNAATKSVSVVLPDGTKKMGGSASWRNNNPLNIKYGSFSQGFGAVQGSAAQDGGKFAAFPSEEAGLTAARNLLQSSSYRNLPLEQAMRRWSGGGYGADVAPASLRGKTTGEMTDDELDQLISSMKKREGWKEGTTYYA